jgi:hypothetical protein
VDDDAGGVVSVFVGDVTDPNPNVSTTAESATAITVNGVPL